jgi:O-antigen/teichoic acid export membrane protein
MVKSGLSLMTGTMATSALGLVFWLLAARLYSKEDLGVASTAVFTMMMLADVACLGLRTGLVRFIPGAGAATGRTIVGSYALVLAASTAVAAVFLAGLGWWAPDLLALRAGFWVAVFYVVATAFWALFMLQDAILVGLRRAPWVPAENSLFGVAKILLLFPLLPLAPELGIFWAWTIPAFPIVFGINALIAMVVGRARHAPAPVRTPSDTVAVHASAASGEAGAAEAVAAAPVSNGAASNAPVSNAGASNASDDNVGSARDLLGSILAFSVADWVASLARLVALTVIPLMVLNAEGREGAAYFNPAWLIAFAVLSLSANAAYALLAETSYERDSLNRNSVQAVLLSLALTVPIIVVGIVGAPLFLLLFGDGFSENSTPVLRLLLLAAIPNVIYQIFVGRLRYQGRMLAVIAVESLLALTVVGLTWVLLPRFGIVGVGLAWLLSLTALALAAVASETLWWWASRVDPRVVRGLARGARWFSPDRPDRGMAPRAAEVVRRLGLDGRAVMWLRGRTERQTAVVTGEQDIMVELAKTEAGAGELRRFGTVVDEISSTPELAAVHRLLPTVLDRRDGDDAFLAWRTGGGVAADRLVADELVHVATVSRLVLHDLEPLHRWRSRPVVVDEEVIESWMSDPVAHLSARGRAGTDGIDRIRRLLLADLVGRTVTVGRIHGELALPNIVMEPEPPTVLGLTRWEWSRDFPLVADPARLALSDLSRRSHRDLGHVVRQLLDDPEPFVSHPAMLIGSLNDVPGRAALILTWLQSVGRSRPPRRAMSPDSFWLARNAQPVMAALADLDRNGSLDRPTAPWTPIAKAQVAR